MLAISQELVLVSQ